MSLNPFYEDLSFGDQSSTEGRNGRGLASTVDDGQPEIPLTHVFGSRRAPPFNAWEVSSAEVYRSTVEPISTVEHQSRDGREPAGDRDVEEAWSFCDVQFRNTSGFTIRYNGPPHAPSFSVRPQGRAENGLPVPKGCAFHGSSLKKARKFCFNFKPTNWQTVKFHRNGAELFHMSYKPNLFAGRDSALITVFGPERNEKIGYIRVRRNIGRSTLIVDCVNGREFTTRRHFNELTNAVEIIDPEGNIAAVMSGTWGSDLGRADCFSINFSNAVLQESGYTKAIFLSALVVMAIDTRGKFLKDDVILVAFGIILVCIMLTLLFLVLSGGK